MSNYEKASVKLANLQLNKLESASKNKTRTTLRITEKNSHDKEAPHELVQTTRQKIKIRNPLADNMSMDIKLSTAQLSKIIQ